MMANGNALLGGHGKFTAAPLTANCRTLAELAQHACVGVSPFNSYFKRARVAGLCQWALPRFERVHFHLPDVPSQYTLTAMGMPADKARRRAHENGLKMRNRIRDGLFHATGREDTELCLLDWEHLRANEAFQRLYRQAQHWFTADLGFRDMCLNASRCVLAHRMPGEPTEAQVNEAVRYFLADIPLLIDTPQIAGVESSVYVYHRTTPFVEALFGNRLPWSPSPHQGYLVLCPADGGE
ncbi:tRNA-dependent cyclodipeptide synthase [Streptomyces aureoverticillatus]|nr:tRNA-dependent cyclodipeptide synthase [Streptomyces aureoverticillatus]